MATFRATLQATCQDDATLHALLGDRWYIANDLPRGGMTPNDAPRAANGVTFLPFGVIRVRSASTVAPLVTGMAGSVEMFVYQDRGYDTIDAAINRLTSRDLFHRANLDPDDRAGVYMQVAFISDPMPDPDMDNAPMQFIRFQTSEIRTL